MNDIGSIYVNNLQFKKKKTSGQKKKVEGALVKFPHSPI